MFRQKAFDKFIIENGICGFSEETIVLASGRITNFYVNWRNILQSTLRLEKLIPYIINFTIDNNISVDTFYGVPEGATPFGILAQYEFSKRFSMMDHVIAVGRKEPKKGRGLEKDKFFVSRPQGKTVVIEDVTTVATNLIPVLISLQKGKVDVSGVITMTNRMEKRNDGLSVRQKVEQMGIPFYQMSSAPELLIKIVGVKIIKKSIIGKVEKYYKKYGIEELCLT